MATIDYAKYANIGRNELFNLLIKSEKQKEQIEQKSRDLDNLIAFLNAKLANEFEKPKYKFYTAKECGLDKVTQKVMAQFTPQELDEIRQEVKEEMSKDYGDEL